MLIVKPDSLPRLWWLFPWSVARQLHRNCNALKALADKTDDENRLLRQEVTRLAHSRDHWIAKHDRAYAVAMHNERVILEMEERGHTLEWLPMDSAPKDGSYFIGGTWGDMESRPTWAAMCSYRAEFNQFQMVEIPDQPDFWLPLPKAPKGVADRSR
jgi:hypothetical protein